MAKMDYIMFRKEIEITKKLLIKINLLFVENILNIIIGSLTM